MLLSVFICTAALFASVSAGFATDTPPDLLKSLTTTTPSKISIIATGMTARQPNEAGLLALDLMFYRWANAAYETDSGINSQDQFVNALTAASSDPVVVWAAGKLDVKDVSTRVAPAGMDDERVKLLDSARKSLKAAVDFSDTSPTKSLENLQSCANALNDLRLDLSWAFVVSRMAERQLFATRQYRDAEVNYEKVHPIYSNYGLLAHVAQVYDDLARLSVETGNFDSAESYYKDSSRQWHALKCDDLAGKQLVHAGLAIASTGKFESAILVMKNGIRMSGEFAYAAKSYSLHTQLLVDVGSFCANRGRYQEANDLLSQAEESAKLSNDPILLGKVLLNHSAVWKASGKDPRARTCQTQRETLLNNTAKEGSAAAPKLSDLSIPAADQNQLLMTAERGAAASEGLGKYQQGIAIYKLVLSVYENLKRDYDRIRILRNMAALYDFSADTQSGLIARRQAAEIAMQMRKPALAVDILRDIERSARQAKDDGTALEALREAVQVLEPSGDRLTLAEVLEARGLLLASKDENADAVRDLDKSASIYASEVDEPWSSAKVVNELADAQIRAESYTDAVTPLISAIKRIEDWSTTEGVDPNADAKHSALLLNLYKQLVRCEMHEGQKSDAVDHLSKARHYSTWFASLRNYVQTSGDPSADEVLKTLDKRPLSPDGTPIKNLPGGIRKIAGDWKSVLNQVPQFSLVARGSHKLSKVGNIDASDIFRVRGLLPDGFAIVEYLVTDTSIYVLVASKTTASCWELPTSSDKIQSYVQALRESLSDAERQIESGIPVPPAKNWTDPDLLPVMEPLYNLEKSLFEPIRGEFKGVKSIAFSLPDELAGVPFHALPLENPSPMRFLIQDCAVSYMLPGSISEFLKIKHTGVDAKKCRVAIFANPADGLSGTVDEAGFIMSRYKNSKLYRGPQATADKFISAASSFNIIHIATHHEADPDPTKMSIVLSGKPGGPGTIDFDDLMRISDNPGLELAVLAACETVGSADIGSSAAAHTAEAFSTAGFPTVIGGLWKISDAASVKLMNSFYQFLATSGQKAQAFRLAQKSMIESTDGKYAHPFYWASFALFGDPR